MTNGKSCNKKHKQAKRVIIGTSAESAKSWLMNTSNDLWDTSIMNASIDEFLRSDRKLYLSWADERNFGSIDKLTKVFNELTANLNEKQKYLYFKCKNNTMLIQLAYKNSDEFVGITIMDYRKSESINDLQDDFDDEQQLCEKMGFDCWF